MKPILIIFALTFLAPNVGMAKRFASQFCEFELPPKWECSLEGSEWVCQSLTESRKKEAIIILAAKKRGQQDSIPQYKSYLERKKTFSLPGGKTQISDPRYVKIVEINNERWVDAMHLASEVPGFYTRYLATVKGELGVAVTFSVAKQHYNAYKALFDSVVKTLRVFSTEKSVTQFKLADKVDQVAGGDLEGDEFIDTEGIVADLGQQRRKGAAGAGGGGDMLLILILVGAVVGFVVWKKRSSKNR